MNMTRVQQSGRVPRKGVVSMLGGTARVGMVRRGLVAMAMAGAVAVTGTGIANAAPAPRHAAVASGVNVHHQLNIVRAHIPSLAHKSDAQVLGVLRSKVHLGNAAAPRSTRFGAGSVHQSVSGVGSGTLWFSRWEMAWWATAGTAAVVAGLVALGVPGITVWGYAGALIATFWSAYWSGYCAWFTYRGRISTGTYRC
jgi:hypothetical protein